MSCRNSAIQRPGEVEAPAIIPHLDNELVHPIAQAQTYFRCPGVLADIVQGFLNHTVDSYLHVKRQPHRIPGPTKSTLQTIGAQVIDALLQSVSQTELL